MPHYVWSEARCKQGAFLSIAKISWIFCPRKSKPSQSRNFLHFARPVQRHLLHLLSLHFTSFSRKNEKGVTVLPPLGSVRRLLHICHCSREPIRGNLRFCLRECKLLQRLRENHAHRVFLALLVNSSAVFASPPPLHLPSFFTKFRSIVPALRRSGYSCSVRRPTEFKEPQFLGTMGATWTWFC